MELLGQISNRWDTLIQKLVPIKLGGKQLLKPGDQFLRRFFTRDKLSLVKAFRVNQQAFDLLDNQFAAELVDIGLIFFFDILEDIDEYGFLFVRKE